jgi:hypothetical protein
MRRAPQLERLFVREKEKARGFLTGPFELG